MSRLDDISLFLRVLDLGSITAAARNMNVSAAVASQRLKRLEQGLNVRLFHRTTRRLNVTAEGRMLAQRSRALVEQLELVTNDLRQTGDNPTGTLRLTMPAAFGRQYISPLLPEFLQQYPAIGIDANLSDELLDIVDAGLDLAIRIGILDDSSLIARKLAENRRVLCAAPAYLDRRGRPATPADLSQHHCLLLTTSPAQGAVWRLLDTAGRDFAVKVSGRISSNQGELLSDAAVGGLGIALHSVWQIHEHLRAGRLEVVLPDYHIASSGIYAVMPQRELVPARVRVFIDFLLERLVIPAHGRMFPAERIR